MIKGDACNILVDSLKADTLDLRHELKLHQGVEVKLKEVAGAKDKQIFDFQTINVELKAEVAHQKKKTKLWIAIAAIELIMFIWIR